MSKSSIASASKSPPQLPSQSAWSKGPPQSNSSPRSQSPAPAYFSHSRRPSNLSQSASISSKDAISVPRNAIGSVKPASVSFGSIDESPPVAAPTVKQDNSKPFPSSQSTLPPQPHPPAVTSHVNGKPSLSSSSSSISVAAKLPMAPSSSASTTASSTPPYKINKSDILKMFQGSSDATSSTTPSDSASPAVRTTALPSQQQSLPQLSQQHQHQQQYPQSQSVPSPSQQSSHYAPFVPGGTIRPQQQNGPGVGPGPVPRSPVYPRAIPNGTGSRPPGGQVGSGGAPPQIPAGLSSPRLSSHPHPGPPSGMPPPPQALPVHTWPYYYNNVPHDQYIAYPPQWYVSPPHAVPHQPQQHQHHAPPPGPPGPPHTMPMSPRHPPPQQLPPGTPTQGHAVLNSSHPSHTQQAHGNAANANMGGITSPPPTPSVVGLGPPPTTQTGGRLNQNASTFVPNRSSSTKVIIKSEDGTEVSLGSLAKAGPSGAAQPPPSGTSSPGGNNTGAGGNMNRRSMSVRMESEEAKRQRMAIEDKERMAKEAEDKARKEKEEKARKVAEEEARKKKEAEERERIRKEEEEKERLRKKEEERERIRKEELERQERIKREEEEEKERLRKEELERKQKEEEKERRRKETEERERLKREEEERIRAEEEAKAEAEAAAAAAAAAAADAAEAEAASKNEADEDAETDVGIPTPNEKETEDGEIVEDTPADQVKDASQNATDDKFKDREYLRIDTSTVKPPSPPSDLPKKNRPAQLDLSYTSKNTSIPAPLPSALATARNIEDLGRVPYPEGVMSPKVELNINAKDGKFRYDRDFLLQFMSICKEKPDMLPPLDAIGLEPLDQSFSMVRGGSSRPRQASGPNLTSSNRNPVGLGFNTNTGFNKPGPANPFMMGNFGTHGNKLNGEDRFSMASGNRVASGPSNLSYTRPVPVVRSASQGGPGAAPGPSMGSNRVRSKRGEKRNDSNKVPGGGQQGHGSAFGFSGHAANALPEPEPLTLSGNRWVPATLSRKNVSIDPDSPEIVDRKVKGLLNKLTMEKFDSISDQIIGWANKSEKEKDGRTLIQVIRLVFEKATDEATWSEMYARLCRKMMEQISSTVQDDGIRNSEGKPITGGQLFRKYLLNRCQEDFERGWFAKEATAAAAASKAKEDEAVKASNEKRSGEEEVALYSEEYYAAQKAKRQGLGLIKFIGELFKLQMLTERIMHECVKKLLGNVQNPEEEEIESLCKLLATVGCILDTTKARAHMDVYFSRMKELVKSPSVTPRMQFMLQDVIELRERKWITRNAVAAPATIAQIHEAAAKEKAAAEKESYQRQMSMSRGGSRRGGDRGDFSQVGPDGWAVAGGSSGPQRPLPKAGDLSNFGKINKSTSLSFGPSSVFAGKKDNSKRDQPLSRTSSSSNIYHLLSEGNADVSMPSKSNHVPRKGSVDIPHVPPEAPQRKKLVLQPRTKPAVEESAPAAATALSSDSSSEDEIPAETMSVSDAMKKIEEDTKEFFAVRNLEEAEEYFTTLPVEHRFRLVDKLVVKAIESKEADAQLVADFFAYASAKDLCSAASLEEGFTPTADMLDDLAIDVPRAFELMAIMMKGAGLDEDEERRTRLASKTDGDKLLSLLS